jgi:hypothetical protein
MTTTRAQSYKLELSKLLLLLVLVPWSSAASASGKIGYGSRAGMVVTVISMSGLDTARAIIRTKHTQEDAEAYCREYVLKVTPDCVRSGMEIRLNDVITANCTSGDFTDFYGARFRFIGRNAKGNTMMPYLIKNIATGQILDGSSASGFPVNLEIFKALCPVTVVRAK